MNKLYLFFFVFLISCSGDKGVKIPHYTSEEQAGALTTSATAIHLDTEEDSDGDLLSDSYEREQGLDPWVANLPLLKIIPERVTYLDQNEHVLKSFDYVEGEELRQEKRKFYLGKIFNGDQTFYQYLDYSAQLNDVLPQEEYFSHFNSFSIEDPVKVDLLLQLQHEGHFHLSSFGLSFFTGANGEREPLNWNEEITLDSQPPSSPLHLQRHNLNPNTAEQIINKSKRLHARVNGATWINQNQEEITLEMLTQSLQEKTYKVVISTPQETQEFFVAKKLPLVDFLETKNIVFQNDHVTYAPDWENEIGLPIDWENLNQQELGLRRWFYLSNKNITGVHHPTHILVYSSLREIVQSQQKIRSIATDVLITNDQFLTPWNYSFPTRPGDRVIIRLKGKRLRSYHNFHNTYDTFTKYYVAPNGNITNTPYGTCRRYFKDYTYTDTAFNITNNHVDDWINFSRGERHIPLSSGFHILEQEQLSGNDFLSEVEIFHNHSDHHGLANLSVFPHGGSDVLVGFLSIENHPTCLNQDPNNYDTSTYYVPSGSRYQFLASIDLWSTTP